jgi:hypothetical protein
MASPGLGYYGVRQGVHTLRQCSIEFTLHCFRPDLAFKKCDYASIVHLTEGM